MGNEFCIGDRVYIPDKQTIIDVSKEYWPYDSYDSDREGYVKEVSKLIGKILTIKDIKFGFAYNNKPTQDLFFEEYEYSLFEYRLIAPLFTLAPMNDTIPDLFGDDMYG